MKYILGEILVFVFILGTVKGFQYSDLQALNASCFKKDSCARDKNSRLTFPVNWKERNCLCDSLCGYYGDCCLDAPTYNASEQKRQNRQQDCVELRNYGGVYMRRACSPRWNEDDSSVAELCGAALPETGHGREDPLLSTPVTSGETRLTYANYYCALCNFDAQKLRMWQPRVECPTLTKVSLENASDSADLVRSLTFSNGSWVLAVNASGVEKHHTCFVDPFIPDDTVNDVRLCKEFISTCPTFYSDEKVAELCDSYTAVVYRGLNTYRNFHCALCNGEPEDGLACYSRDFIRFNFNDDFNPAAFSILFDFDDSQGGDQVGYRCQDTQVWDPFFKRCRQVRCANTATSYENGRCLLNETLAPRQPNDASVTNSPSKKDRFVYVVPSNNFVHSNETHKSLNIIVFPDELATEPVPALNSSEEKAHYSLNCNRILLPFGEYDARDNGTIFVAKYDRSWTEGEFEPHEDGVLVCLTLPQAQKFSHTMGWITLAGLGVSVTCLGLHLIAFCLVSELRNLSGRNLASLSLCLLCAYLCFILSVFGEEGHLECVVLGCAMYFFFLSSFCWMNVMAYDIWKTLLEATSELKLSSGRQCGRSVAYSTYALLSPAAALALVLVIDKGEWIGFPASYLPRMGERLCWFGQRKALLVFFGAPLALIMAVNVIFFVLSARMIASAARATARYSAQRRHHSRVKLYMRLALLMGMSWIVGVLAGYLHHELLWYVFIFLNTLQGAFIFAAFTCKKKVFNLLRCSRARRRASSRPIVSVSRRNLSAQQSSESSTSRCSAAHLSPNAEASSTSIDL